MSYLHPNLVNLRQSLDTTSPPLYKLPYNFATQNLESIFYFFSTPSSAPIGPYDQFVVSTTGTVMGLNNVYRVLGDMTVRMKLKVDTLGTTSPIMGFFFYGAKITSDIDDGQIVIFLDMKNSLIPGTTPKIGRNPIATVRNNSYQNITTAQTAIILVSGDTIEIEYVHSMSECLDTFSVRNQANGQYIVGKTTSLYTQDTYASYIQHLGIYLQDGTYTILDVSIESDIPKYPKVHVIGDSMGRGSKITATQSLPYKMKHMIPYNTANSCSGGAYIYNILKTEIQDIIKLYPETVLMMHYIQLSYRDFETSSPNNATYMVAFNAVINGIIGIGSIPILVKMPFWPFPAAGSNPAVDQATMDAWYAFVDAQVVIFPTMLVLDLRAFTLTYDSTGYHYDDNSNTIVTQQLVQLLSSNGLLP